MARPSALGDIPAQFPAPHLDGTTLAVHVNVPRKRLSANTTHTLLRIILTAIFEKLGAANRAEAVSIALRKHLLMS